MRRGGTPCCACRRSRLPSPAFVLTSVPGYAAPTHAMMSRPASPAQGTGPGHRVHRQAAAAASGTTRRRRATLRRRRTRAYARHAYVLFSFSTFAGTFHVVWVCLRESGPTWRRGLLEPLEHLEDIREGRRWIEACRSRSASNELRRQVRDADRRPRRHRLRSRRLQFRAVGIRRGRVDRGQSRRQCLSGSVSATGRCEQSSPHTRYMPRTSLIPLKNSHKKFSTVVGHREMP